MSSAQACAEKFGGEPMSVDEQWRRPEIDAVMICSPTDVHCKQILQAFQAGKKIFCEKPLVRHLQEARQLSNSVAANLYPGHVLRFFHLYNRARQIIQRGDLGKIKKIVCRRLNRPRQPGQWFADLQRSGGVLLDLMIHDFDWLMWCFGEPQTVRILPAAGEDKEAIAADGHGLYARVLLIWPDGIRAEVEGSWLHEQPETTLLVEGELGNLVYDWRTPEVMLVSVGAYQRQISLAGLPDPFEMQMRHFSGWLRGILEPVVTFEEAVRAVSLSLHALDLAKQQT